MRKSIKSRRYNLNRTRRKGSGITTSKPVSPYPPLPETPTNRPQIKINTNNLEPVKGEEKAKRYLPLAKRVINARKRSTMNIILKREKPKPKLNSYGEPKSFFTINNNVGFRPTKS